MNTVFNELVKDYGFENTTYNPAFRPTLSTNQVCYLMAKYPMAKAKVIATRHGSLTRAFRLTNASK